MTPAPAPNTQSIPWWQTILITIANLAVTALVNRYLGPGPAAGTMAAGTAIAHVLPSPLRKR
jgi:hypothetical protein